MQAVEGIAATPSISIAASSGYYKITTSNTLPTVTQLYYNSSLVGAGTYTLSSSWTNFKYLILITTNTSNTDTYLQMTVVSTYQLAFKHSLLGSYLSNSNRACFIIGKEGSIIIRFNTTTQFQIVTEYYGRLLGIWGSNDAKCATLLNDA